MATKKTTKNAPKKATYKSVEAAFNAPLKKGKFTPSRKGKELEAAMKRAKDQADKIDARRAKPEATVEAVEATVPKKADRPHGTRRPGKPKKLSLINAAHQVLHLAAKPLGCKAMVELVTDQGLWASPAGKTPHATLYSAILREIATKGEQARFRKTDRGLFEANG